MFCTSPINKEETIIDTPIKATLLKSLFFVNKNGQSFQFGKAPDSIRVIIDGRVIAKDLFLLPFMTESPKGNHYDWDRCALRLNIPICNSEVKISGLRANDVNMVFRYSDEPAADDSKPEVCENLIFRLYETGEKQQYGILKPISVTNGTNNSISLEEIPQRFFLYPYYTVADGSIYLLPKDILNEISVKLTSAQQIIDADFSAHALSVTESLAWRDVDYTFDRTANKNMTVKFDYSPALAAAMATGIMEIDGRAVQSIDLAIHFISQ